MGFISFERVWNLCGFRSLVFERFGDIGFMRFQVSLRLFERFQVVGFMRFGGFSVWLLRDSKVWVLYATPLFLPSHPFPPSLPCLEIPLFVPASQSSEVRDCSNCEGEDDWVIKIIGFLLCTGICLLFKNVIKKVL